MEGGGFLTTTTVFGSIPVDVLVAFFFGMLGGLASELIDLKGDIEKPHFEKDGDKANNFNLGVFSKIIVGGIAAVAFFFVADRTDALKFVGATVAAGFGD